MQGGKLRESQELIGQIVYKGKSTLQNAQRGEEESLSAKD